MIRDVGTRDLVVDRPEEELFCYHRSTMTSPEILEAEQRRIFDKCWLYLGHESEVPNLGDYKRRDVGGRPVFFVRSRKSGEVNVFYNTCVHRGATICRHDEGNAKSLQCFYHAWTYDTDGNLIGVPDEKAFGGFWEKSKMGLRPVARTESYRGFIFVTFNPVAEDLSMYLAGAKEYIDDIVDGAQVGAASPRMEILRGTHSYGIKANWKLMAENSADGYHVAPTHASYLEYLKNLGTDISGGIKGGISKDLGNGHSVIESPGPWGRPIAKWNPLFGEDSREEVEGIRNRLINEFGEDRGRRIADINCNIIIFPNLVINDIMSVVVRTMQPIRPDYAEVTQWELVPKGERPDVRARRLDSFLTFLGPGGFATPEDTEAVESCQQGFQANEVEWNYLARGFHNDPPTNTDEFNLRTFWRRWQQMMLAEEAR